MNKRYMFEIGVGVITLASVLLFGPAGYASFALMAFMAFFGKKKPDERELQLFYKAGNLTIAPLILGLVLINMFQDSSFVPVRIGDYWLNFAIAVFLISHGVCGLAVSYRE